MLPRRHRAGRKGFGGLFKDGRSITSNNLSLRWSVKGEAPPQLSVVVSAKTAPKAVARNQLKRRCRAVLAKVLPELKPGLVAAIFLRPGATTLTFGELSNEIALLLKRARVL